MYEGWQEVVRATRFDSWEQARIIAYYSLASNPYAKPPKLSQFFKNPYSEVKEKEVKYFTPEEVTQRLQRWDVLEYKEYKE